MSEIQVEIEAPSGQKVEVTLKDMTLEQAVKFVMKAIGAGTKSDFMS